MLPGSLRATDNHPRATIFERLTQRFPSVDERHLFALAEVWSTERDQIIQRMLDICRDEVGPAMAIDARTEAIFELAKLIMWLEARIIEKKTQDTVIEQVDPVQERLALSRTTTQERIENTARLCADRIWKRFLGEWHRRFPLVVDSQEQGRPKKRSRVLVPRESPGVKTQHYSPRFSNEYWATGPGKLVRVYFLGVDGGLRSHDRSYKKWGRELFLYSQGLERLFALVEGDAKLPYTKLLESVPLYEKERQLWIAFLLAQIFRTPSFVLKILPALKQWIKAQQIVFPTETGRLRQAYETLFSNNEVFGEFHRLITAQQWEMWSAPSNGQFIRSDDPILIRGSVEHGTWQLIYPMTPVRCFVVGPGKVENASTVVPQNRQLSDLQLRGVNKASASATRMSVIGMPVDNDSALRSLLEETLERPVLASDWRGRLFPEFWGPIE